MRRIRVGHLGGYHQTRFGPPHPKKQVTGRCPPRETRPARKHPRSRPEIPRAWLLCRFLVSWSRSRSGWGFPATTRCRSDSAATPPSWARRRRRLLVPAAQPCSTPRAARASPAASAPCRRGSGFSVEIAPASSPCSDLPRPPAAHCPPRSFFPDLKRQSLPLLSCHSLPREHPHCPGPREAGLCSDAPKPTPTSSRNSRRFSSNCRAGRSRRSGRCWHRSKCRAGARRTASERSPRERSRTRRATCRRARGRLRRRRRRAPLLRYGTTSPAARGPWSPRCWNGSHTQAPAPISCGPGSAPRNGPPRAGSPRLRSPW